MKGSAGSPIWIVVTLLLALVVGITMYQLLRSTNANKTFDDWIGEVSSGQAEISLTSFCESWHDQEFVTVNQEKLATATAAAAHPGMTVKYFTAEEFDMGERLSPCDCAVYLFQKGELDKLEVSRWYDPDECHEMTNNVAESRNLVGN